MARLVAALASLVVATALLWPSAGHAYPPGVDTWMQFDINDNGMVTFSDAVFVQRCFFNVGPCAPEHDVNQNGMTNNTDGVLVAQCSFQVFVCPEFELVPVVTDLDAPTAMDVAPDGRIFVAEQGGILKVIDGANVSTFWTVTTSMLGERGLTGVAYHEGWAYIYYAATTPTIHARVSRTDGLTEEVLLDLETLDNMSGFHVGGGLVFAGDLLYIGRGDDRTSNNAQSMTTTEGKVLRIDPDDLPADPLTAIFARGFRNPFSLASDGAVVYVNDVGEEAWEEVNVLAQGANYGWPQCEGPCSVAGMTNPLHAYASTGLSAITGGAFYDGPLQGMSGHYFVGDWGQNRVRRLNDATSFPAFDVSGPVDVAMKGGELYVLTQGGTLYRAEVQ